MADFNEQEFGEPGRTSASFHTVRGVRKRGDYEVPAVVVIIHDDGGHEFAIGPDLARRLAKDLLKAADFASGTESGEG